MFKFLTKLWKNRRGNALVIFGAALPLIIGGAGLATDTIQWSLWKRQAQRAADSAALAGAFGRQAGQTVVTDSATCDTSPPISRDLVQGDVSNRLGTVPACATVIDGWGAATNKSVQVTISVTHSLPFSSMIMKATPTITATATAAMVQNGRYCMVSMDTAAETGINFTGSAKINLGCGMKTNAKGTKAIDCGGSSTITASPVAAVGYIPTCSNFASGTTYQSYSPPQTDPYGTIPVPSVPTSPPCNTDLPNSSQTIVGTGSWADNTPTTVCYTDFTVGSGKTFTGSDLVIIINKDKSNGSGGNLTLQGNVTCTRCLFVLTSNSTDTPTPIGNVTINSTAHLNLSSPTAGTYSGILLYQDRRASTCGNYCNKINGDANSVISGAIYMPKQEIQFDGGSGMTTNCLQLVGWQLQFAGNTTVNNSCPGGQGGFDGWMIRLVA